jgi:hypothetical protein
LQLNQNQALLEQQKQQQEYVLQANYMAQQQSAANDLLSTYKQTKALDLMN